jgi:hypothetical protein
MALGRHALRGVCLPPAVRRPAEEPPKTCCIMRSSPPAAIDHTARTPPMASPRERGLPTELAVLLLGLEVDDHHYQPPKGGGILAEHAIDVSPEVSIALVARCPPLSCHVCLLMAWRRPFLLAARPYRIIWYDAIVALGSMVCEGSAGTSS